MSFKDQLDNCISQWHSGGCLSLINTNEFPACPVRFEDDDMIFSSEYEKGFTAYAVWEFDNPDPVKYQFQMFSSNSESYFDQTQILLNGDPFVNIHWTTTLEAPEPPSINQPVMPILLHEMGHLIGLGHHPIVMEGGEQSVMSSVPYLFDISSWDEDHRELICTNNGTPVGIEDYIWINLSTSLFNVNQTYVGSNNAYFVDVDPVVNDPDYIVQWYPWQIKAFNGCDEVVIFEYQTGGFIKVPPLPTGYLWDRDEFGNVKALISTSAIDNDGTTHTASAHIKIANVPPNSLQTSGILTHSTCWSGDINIIGTVTIPSGMSLKIFPGTSITFANGASLIVQGTLEAISCTLKTNSGTWGNLTFDGIASSSSILDNVTIISTNQIECKNGADVTIQNSKIENGTHGIYIYNSAPKIINNRIIENYGNGIYGEANGKSPLIQSNTIKKFTVNLNNYQGIYLGNFTNPYITGNDIQGFSSGIYYGGGGHSWFTDNVGGTPAQNNRLVNNVTGLVIAWGSVVTAGLPVAENPGSNNSIYNNSLYDLRAYQSGSINAAYNWWGTDGLQYSVATGGSISYADLPLSSDPWSGVPLRPSNQPKELYDKPNSDNIIAGLLFEIEGNLSEAISHYKKMLKLNSSPEFALNRLVGIRKKNRLQHIQNYLENLVSGNNLYKPTLLNLIAGMKMDSDNYEEAMSLYDLIINLYPNSYHSINAKFEKFYAALNFEKNQESASQLLAELQSLSLNDEDFIIRLRDAEYLLTNSIEKNSRIGKLNSVAQAEKNPLPNEYALLGNYPNPFNPATTIAFNIPVISNIELRIYDILGNEIRAFYIPSQSAGRQNITWDGKNSYGANVASGIYIYKFTAVPLEADFKVFEKSAKLIMMK